ncbi:MAG: bifunctional 3,4-dihydroxy-2-butanone-4-phosphate synthase/GTP cyclohydrolase II, partial [Proteobacteria bacterium]|nr:bifunctional 3,4-dihydroxy-2-butanone-4-phosphate synthase/GTP cyclohydrolase II [Pseudomonadota bacterium]
MPLCSIEQAIEDLRAGKMIIMVDDEDRENEGDLVCAAESVTPEIINFMATHGRGLICLAMSADMVARLELPMMSQSNKSQFGTNFTVSIEAREGVTTGISAADRAKTILTAVDDGVRPQDIVSPGHIFPLRARKGGTLVRAGQTEGSVDLATLAGMKPAGVICEIMNDDGTMARLDDLELYAKKHSLNICSVADLIAYRMRFGGHTVTKVAEAELPTRYGDFKTIAFHSEADNKTHIALIKGKIEPGDEVLVRVHSECLTGDVFGSRRCDCGNQLNDAMCMIEREGKGLVLYMRQEGRGIGLGNKIKAYHLQDEGLDTVEANERLGFAPDLREYGTGAQMLVALGVTKMRLLTNNPKKIIGLEGYGLEVVERMPIETGACAVNLGYRKTKKEKMGHILTIEDSPES